MKKASIIIPAHNEEVIIEKTLKLVSSAMKKSGFNYEIVAVDDNSNDKTWEMMKKVAKINKKVKPFRKTSNSRGPTGLGSAVRFGFKHANGDVLVPFMGDLSDDPEDVPKLLKKIEEGYDVVCGSRFVKGSYLKGYPSFKLFINRLFNEVFRFLFWIDVKDISNAFKAYKIEVIKKVRPESNGFEITSEIVLKARIYGFRIAEVGVGWRGRKSGEGESKFLSSFSPTFIFKKVPMIGWQYGITALKIWLLFISKKLHLS